MILLLCFLECFSSKDIKFKNRWCYLKSIGGCGKIVFKDSWVIELINNQRRKRSTAFNCKILFCFDNSNFGFAKVLMIQFIFSQKRFTPHLPPFEINHFKNIIFAIVQTVNIVNIVQDLTWKLKKVGLLKQEFEIYSL